MHVHVIARSAGQPIGLTEIKKAALVCDRVYMFISRDHFQIKGNDSKW